jgi:hypothetical protein
VKLFGKGHRVTQPTYGAGTITSSDDRYTVIEFDQHGRRVFLTDMVKLARTDEPAPERPVRERRKAAPKPAADASGKAPAKPAKASRRSSSSR